MASAEREAEKSGVRGVAAQVAAADPSQLAGVAGDQTTRRSSPSGQRSAERSPTTLTRTSGRLPALRLQLIEDLAGRRLLQQYLQRYHPLGYRVPYGAQLRYLVRARSQDVLACLLFTD